MRKLLLLFLAFLCLMCRAQEGSFAGPVKHIMTQNGAIVTASYNKNSKILNVDIRNNTEELEIVVVANGSVVESQISDFEHDAIDVDLSTHKNAQIDVYVRNREEEYYVGNMNKTK